MLAHISLISQITTTNFNKNLPSCKYQLSSTIQRTSRRVESKTGKGGQSQRMESRKN